MPLHHPSENLGKCNNCFQFFFDNDMESHTEHFDLHERIVWLGFSEGAEQPESWQALGSAFALKPAAASVSGCFVVRKEKDAGDRLSDLGAASLQVC